MLKKIISLIIISSSLISFNIFAEEADNSKTQTNSSVSDKVLSSQIQQVLDEYKSYVSTLPKDVREEVVNYRKEIAKLNREKRELYQKLSSKAQEHLAKEQEFKKKKVLWKQQR